MACTYSFNPSMLHVGSQGTTAPVPVSFDTNAGCPYFSITQLADLQPWWQTQGLTLGQADDLAQNFTVTCKKNTDPAPRMDTIIIMTGGDVTLFTILQDGGTPLPPGLKLWEDSYNAFITRLLLRFWWWGPPGPPTRSGGVGDAQIQNELARTIQMMVSKVDEGRARQLLQEAVALMAQTHLKSLKNPGKK